MRTVEDVKKMSVKELREAVINLEQSVDFLGLSGHDDRKNIRWLESKLELQAELFRELIGLEKIKKAERKTELPF